MYYIIASIILNGTYRVVGTTAWLITPSVVYNTVEGVYEWLYPPKTETLMLMDELKLVNENLMEIREMNKLNGVFNCDPLIAEVVEPCEPDETNELKKPSAPPLIS
jgi:hypothetical protein